MKSIQIIVLSLIIISLVLIDSTQLGQATSTLLSIEIPTVRAGLGIFAGLNIAFILVRMGQTMEREGI